MKSVVPQSIYCLLALFILAAAVAPACAGGENCSMPCCRHKAKPLWHHPTDAPSKACCTRPADASSDIGSSCRFDQHHLAISSQERTPARTNSAPAAAVFADATWTAEHDHAWPAPRIADHPESPKAPLYLRIQILLI
jgi:hypothetical protein